MALNKLRATLDEARLSQADDTAKLSALWDRLTFAKQAGRQVDLRATIFGCLASEAEREADKLVRRHELRPSKQPEPRDHDLREPIPHTWVSSNDNLFQSNFSARSSREAILGTTPDWPT